MNSVCSRFLTACQKTISDPGNAKVLGTIAAGAVLSSAFRAGLMLSPIGMISSFGMALLARTQIGERIFSKLTFSSSSDSSPSRISSLFQRIMPKDPAVQACIAAPLIEEGIFRGVIQGASVAALGAAPGIVLSSLLFSAAHCDPAQPQQTVNSFLGGVIMGIVKEKFSILGFIGFHMGVNTFWGPILGLASPNGLVRNFLTTR
ncbi:MAG: CPBP family intramembrane metalloprotease [Parachlamydiales bacterium]|nr:CPBP family intramembrane metalloprotease [Parachlamydiales bacterium]